MPFHVIPTKGDQQFPQSYVALYPANPANYRLRVRVTTRSLLSIYWFSVDSTNVNTGQLFTAPVSICQAWHKPCIQPFTWTNYIVWPATSILHMNATFLLCRWLFLRSSLLFNILRAIRNSFVLSATFLQPRKSAKRHHQEIIFKKICQKNVETDCIDAKACYDLCCTACATPCCRPGQTTAATFAQQTNIHIRFSTFMPELGWEPRASQPAKQT